MAVDDMNPRWDGHGPLTATEIRECSRIASYGESPAPAAPLTATEVREKRLGPPRDVDAPFRTLVERTREILEKHGLLPMPVLADGRFVTPPDPKRYVLVTGVIGGGPAGSVAAKDAETIQREKDRRLEQLRQYCEPDAPRKMVARLDNIDTSPAASAWVCLECKVRGGIGTLQHQESYEAHLATVAHDRAMESHLRLNVDNARKQVETARERLYDYLKSKGRAA